MKLNRLASAALILLLPVFCFAQTGTKAKLSIADESPLRSSSAYSEVLLRKTELESDVESLLMDYTEDFPKIQEERYGLSLIDAEMKRLLTVKPADASKLTLALGKMIVRKVELETELWLLQKKYKEDHPEVKRARKKVEIFERAIKEILG
jgi:hypothetical protein